jgi:hypothetical protein
MATKRPRIMFTPSDRAFAAIRRVAAVTERPVSAVVSEQVEVLTEHLEGLASILELAKRIQREEPQAVAAAARAAFEQMLPILENAEADVQAIWDDLAAQYEFDDLDPNHPTPPSSNTGATIPQPPSHSPRRKAASHA